VFRCCPAHLRTSTKHTAWPQVRDEDVKAWLVYLLDHYSDSYANNQYRALQQFFKWHSEDEELRVDGAGDALGDPTGGVISAGRVLVTGPA